MTHHDGILIQYRRMGVLAMAHFLADSSYSILACCLPAVLTWFGLDLSYGVMIVSTMAIGSNLLQIPAAKLGSGSTSARWIIIGLLLLGLTGTIGLFPRQTPFFLLCLLMFAASAGVAIVHPAGLRGVQALRGLAPGMTTPIFMTGGFLSVAITPWAAGMLVERFGLKGLLLFLIPVAAAVLLIFLFRIRVEPDGVNHAGRKGELSSPWSFSRLIVIASLLNCGSTAFTSLVPYMLNMERGFSLSFSSLSVMLFGGGSTAISVLLGVLSGKRNIGKPIVWMLLAGIPVSFLFFFLSAHWYAIFLALFAGALCSSPYPILVAMSKTAEGKVSLGMRMGLMVGGTWGFSGLVFLGIGALAERFTALHVLGISVPGFYLLGALTALFTAGKFAKKK